MFVRVMNHSIATSYVSGRKSLYEVMPFLPLLYAIRVMDNLRRHIRAMPQIIPVACATKDDPVEPSSVACGNFLLLSGSLAYGLYLLSMILTGSATVDNAYR